MKDLETHKLQTTLQSEKSGTTFKCRKEKQQKIQNIELQFLIRGESKDSKSSRVSSLDLKSSIFVETFAALGTI
jgi:hypothetical protein